MVQQASLSETLTKLREGNGICYLACPYTHENPEVMSARYLAASNVTASLMLQGLTVFSPLTHGHPLSMMFGLPQAEWSFWSKQTLPMVEASSALLVMLIDGWDSSRGVNEEVSKAKEFRIPTFTVEIHDDHCAVTPAEFDLHGGPTQILEIP